MPPGGRRALAGRDQQTHSGRHSKFWRTFWRFGFFVCSWKRGFLIGICSQFHVKFHAAIAEDLAAAAAVLAFPGIDWEIQ